MTNLTKAQRGPTAIQRAVLIEAARLNRSGHKKCAIMEALAKKGLVEKRSVSVFESRFFITQAGRDALK